ncbi:MAG: hypothetical protein J6C52_05605 [Clostridia bacterium]|nr:hypothetical protein [Clostridia bacterium]
MQKRVLYLLLLTLIFLVGCSAGEEVVETVPLDDWQSYTVIRPDITDEATTDAFLHLVNTVEEKTGCRLAIGTDWVKRTEKMPVDSKEILIGFTNRPESISAADGIQRDDYIIRLDGTRVVILGGSTDALTEAVDFYLTHMIDEKNRTITVPAEEIVRRGEYLFDSFSVDGTPIGDMMICNASLEDAGAFSARLGKCFGIDLPTSISRVAGKPYIVLDGSGLIADAYSITVEDGCIILRGSRHSLPAAMDAFIESYLPGLGARDYNLTAADNYTGSTGKKEIYSKAQLMQLLTDVYEDENVLIIGEQSVGTDADVLAKTIKTFADVTGEEPGILGIDLACYGLDIQRHGDLAWSGWICDIVDYCAEGGIVTASAHFDNPSGNHGSEARVRGVLGYEDTREGYEKAFRDVITEGTELNAVFKKELDADARFFKALGDNGVTIIWRPLHEANGGWFWFCTTQKGKTLDASYLIDLWHYIYDYFTKEKGLTNLIWNHSPNASSNVTDKPGSTMSTTYLYPGDAYCDMVGLDWYSGGKLEITNGDNYKKLIEKSGKIGAITEFGPSGSILAEKMEDQPALYDSMDLLEDLTELREKGLSFSYLLTWTSKWSIRAMGRGDEFMQAEMTLGREDVKAMFAKMK